MADADKTALDAAQARYAAERTKRLRVDDAQPAAASDS